MSGNVKIIIPARYGSKGAPLKNRRLIQYTVDAARQVVTDDDIYISTDDEEIKEKFNYLNIIHRPYEFGTDTASVKDVILHAKGEIKPSDDTLLVVLYPTYPQRTSDNIKDAIVFFETHDGKSLLCRKHYTGLSPYLMMFPVNDWSGVMRGKQVIKHDLYRRQDYQPVFEICHFIIIMKAGEVEKLNNNLYDDDTIFFPINNGFIKLIDVDEEKDVTAFLNLYTVLTQTGNQDG